MIDLATIKDGDLVRFLPYKMTSEMKGEIEGIFIHPDMHDYIGAIGVVTSVMTDSVRTSVCRFFWPPSLVEKVDLDKDRIYTLMKVCFGGGVIPVLMKPTRFKGYFTPKDSKWNALLGSDYETQNVRIGEPCIRKLTTDLFNVGKSGDEVYLVKIKDRYYLDPDYLPIYGDVNWAIKEDDE